MTMIKILGARIRKSREDLGITQDDLAKAIGCSSEFISLLELGKRAPRLESLLLLADYLKKDISYFLPEKDNAFNILLRKEGLNKKSKSELKKFKTFCDEYIKLEELTGRRLPLAPLYHNVSAERMAEEERCRLGLGDEPIRDVFSLLELNGLHIIRYSLNKDIKISGVYIFLEEQDAAFALVNSSQSLGRQVMIAAHEYSHYLKDRYGGPVIDNPDLFVDEYLSLYHPRESFAQKFAVNFLIPTSKIHEIIRKDIRKKNIIFEDVLYLKRYFGVSTLAMLRKLAGMEYISPGKFAEYQKLDPDKHEQDLFGSLAEDGQLKIGRRKILFSDRFRSLVFEARSKNKISDEKAASLL